MGLIRDTLQSGLGRSQNSFGQQPQQQQPQWGVQQQWSSQQSQQCPAQFSNSSPYRNSYATQARPSFDYGQAQDPYSSRNYGPPPALPPRNQYRSTDGAPAYGAQDDNYYNQPSPMLIAPYSSSSSPQPSLTTMAPGPLQRPFVLPQGTGSGTPIVRGFGNELAAAGVSSREMIEFIDALNLTTIPNPEMQLANTAAGLAGWFVPGLAAGIALTGVQVIAQVGGAVVVKGATKSCLANANQNIFFPRGLEVQLQSTQQLNTLLGVYNTNSPPTFSLDPMSRLQIYAPYISPVSTVLPPVQGAGRTDPIAQLGSGLSNRKQNKQQRKAEEDAAKGKMKKADKVEKGLVWLAVTNSSQPGAGGARDARPDWATGGRAEDGDYGQDESYLRKN
ncbi:hypothetical protein P7C70_g2610, partial [Phenoliferia sp. Uapishka_3]